MKAKRIITLMLAVILTLMTVVSVSAADLTDDEPSGQTEVKARIEGGSPQPGDVTYIITIPDVVDFGVLTQPADDSVDSFKDVNYTVTATEINNLDPDAQQVSVYVRDENATVNGDQEFYIANKTDSTKKFTYDVYTDPEVGAGSVNINRNTMTLAAGYYLAGFTAAGEEIEGTLRLNQVQLCDYDLAEIVGDYSGYMVFFSAVEDI